MPDRGIAVPRPGFFVRYAKRYGTSAQTMERWPSRPRFRGRGHAAALTARATLRGVDVVKHGGPSLCEQVMV